MRRWDLPVSGRRPPTLRQLLWRAEATALCVTIFTSVLGPSLSSAIEHLLPPLEEILCENAQPWPFLKLTPGLSGIEHVRRLLGDPDKISPRVLGEWEVWNYRHRFTCTGTVQVWFNGRGRVDWVDARLDVMVDRGTVLKLFGEPTWREDHAWGYVSHNGVQSLIIECNNLDTCAEGRFSGLVWGRCIHESRYRGWQHCRPTPRF